MQSAVEMSVQDEVTMVIDYLMTHDIIRKEYFTRASDRVAAAG